MEDSFDVAGFREETNKSLVFSHLLHFPSHPIPLSYVFCRHSYVIYSYFCPVCPHIFFICHQLSYSSTSSISMFLPHLMPVSAPLSPFQPYYANRASLPPNSGPRGVPPTSGPRPVTPTHVYQAGPGSQMMMIPGQQLPFPSSPQGPAYFIPGQVGHTEKRMWKL